MATPCAAVKVASKGVTWNRVAGIPYAAIRRRFASACGISDSPGPLSHYSAQDGSVEQPWARRAWLSNDEKMTLPGVAAGKDMFLGLWPDTFDDAAALIPEVRLRILNDFT